MLTDGFYLCNLDYPMLFDEKKNFELFFKGYFPKISSESLDKIDDSKNIKLKAKQKILQTPS